MDRLEFEKRITDDNLKVLTDRQLAKAIDKSIENSIEAMGQDEAFRNHLTHSIEECAELQQVLTKYLRGKGSYLDFVQEFGHVTLTMMYLKRVMHMTDDEMERSMSVTMHKVMDVEAEVGCYK